ncbi:MAG TPA: heavy-metal-associated domain-containing protein [Gemmatimonadaceae bacterium]|nr:heavy-metal-associated domain-containing protein [Gemmatimonadaceae bacterium]
MTTHTLSIDGMSCGHCVSAVRQALASVPGVTVQDVQIGKATIQSADPLPAQAIKDAVEDAGYFASSMTPSA